jgi:hypothetical protein
LKIINHANDVELSSFQFQDVDKSDDKKLNIDDNKKKIEFSDYDQILNPIQRFFILSLAYFSISSQRKLSSSYLVPASSSVYTMIFDADYIIRLYIFSASLLYEASLFFHYSESYNNEYIWFIIIFFMLLCWL